MPKSPRSTGYWPAGLISPRSLGGSNAESLDLAFFHALLSGCKNEAGSWEPIFKASIGFSELETFPQCSYDFGSSLKHSVELKAVS